MADFDRESMLEMFNYEMNQLIESLESTVLEAEDGITTEHINEIFRVMHTIKGSAAMMKFDNISTVAHAIEDMFFYLRDNGVQDEHNSSIADLVFEGMDFIKIELAKIESGEKADGINDDIVANLKSLLAVIKGEEVEENVSDSNQNNQVASRQSDELSILSSYLSEDFVHNKDRNMFSTKVMFDEDTQMVNVRAYSVLTNYQEVYSNVVSEPEELLADDAIGQIESDGLKLNFSCSLDFEATFKKILKIPYLNRFNIKELVLGEEVDQNIVNTFELQLNFTNGYGDEASNVISVIKCIENSSVAIEIIDFIPENKNTDCNMRIFTKLPLAKLSELILKSGCCSISSIEEIKKIKETEEVQAVESAKDDKKLNEPTKVKSQATPKKSSAPQVISVSISKLDMLLNLMGELVISEAMVTQNPDLDGLDLQNFSKESRQLRKIINDVQDVVMSMRMVPLSTVFFKMHRIVRDMSKQLQKEVNLNIIGEETEVDKNIIEHISDPLMHMIRNSIDHGLEKTEEDRLKVGKSKAGNVTLEAKNSGGDVLIIIKDDGRGINTDVVYEKAKNNGLIDGERSDYTDKELNMLIFEPGFSTNQEVTNYSGRGVGMDVVNTNLQSVGGSVDVISEQGVGTQFILKIPLTLAIIEGMNIKIGGDMYTIPIISIRQSFKAKNEDITLDPEGNEIIKVRGEIYNLIRLHEYFDLESDVTDIEDGIMILVENGDSAICLFADELVGEHQVVVKTMPKLVKKTRSLAGCTLLGNGDISLIIDVAGFFGK